MRDTEIYKKEVVTCAEMKALEKAADEAGLSYSEMMENAGRKVAETAVSMLAGDPGKGEVVVLCGRGNNAGDGFVAARILDEKGFDVRIALIYGEPKTVDSIANFKLAKEAGIEITAGTPPLGSASLIIDAIYGTGFRGAPDGAALEAITAANEAHAKILAVDIPSGLPGDIAEDTKLGISVIADVTITFHAQKEVHRFKEAADRCGRIITADIGITEALEKSL